MATTFMHPSLSVRGRVFFHRGALVRRLAAGASPSDSPELARRAQQLCSPRHRRLLASGLERVIDEAQEGRRPYSAAVPLRRRAILSERVPLLGLAFELRDTAEEVSSHGVALIEQLLSDGGSPLYTENPDESLEGAIRRARAALLLR
jgi:hypothetical protein